MRFQAFSRFQAKVESEQEIDIILDYFLPSELSAAVSYALVSRGPWALPYLLAALDFRTSS
jgi:hypothetical protein